jgi:hypothetical protein
MEISENELKICGTDLVLEPRLRISGGKLQLLPVWLYGVDRNYFGFR